MFRHFVVSHAPCVYRNSIQQEIGKIKGAFRHPVDRVPMDIFTWIDKLTAEGKNKTEKFVSLFRWKSNRFLLLSLIML